MVAKRRLLASILVTLLGAAGLAQAADKFPSRPIQVTVPYAPGGTADVLIRLLQPGMEKSLGQPIVVHNRAGASGLIGTELIARAEPDGYHLVVATAGLPIAAAYSRERLSFNIRKDFEPVAAYAETPYFLFVNAKLPIESVKDFVARAKAEPGKLTYGSSGAGQSGHLAGARFALAAGVDMLHVPYKGTGPAMTDLASGHIDSILVGLPIAQAQLKAGRVRVLAVAAAERVPFRTDIPTTAEAGISGFEARAWYGLLAPAGTPRAVRERLATAVKAAMDDPALGDQLTALGAIRMVQGVDEFGRFFSREVEDNETFIKNFPGGLK